jgi:hypothetical protein
MMPIFMAFSLARIVARFAQEGKRGRFDCDAAHDRYLVLEASATNVEPPLAKPEVVPGIVRRLGR